MATTTVLGFDLLDEGQRQKTATINDAFNTLDGAVGRVLGVYTVGTLPAASSHANKLAIVTDVGDPDRKVLAYSDGTNWREIVTIDDTIVAA